MKVGDKVKYGKLKGEIIRLLWPGDVLVKWEGYHGDEAVVQVQEKILEEAIK